jgi:hypothetical protein
MREDLRNRESEAYKAKAQVALRAFESGCLIWCQDSKKFYTPREFMDSEEVVKITHVELQQYKNYTLVYPQHAIQRQLNELLEAQKEFGSFMARLLNAFELHPMKPDKKKS